MKLFRKIPFKKLFIAGFIFGTSMGGIYIAAGGKTVLGVPDWAKVIFYPGFLAGDWFYGNIFSSMKPAHIFGLLAVGITYGLLFQAIYFIKKVLLGK